MTSKQVNFLKRTIIGITLVIILGTLPKYFFVQPINAHSINNRESIENSLLDSQINHSQLVQQDNSKL